MNQHITTTATHVVDQITTPSTYQFPLGIFDAVYDRAIGMFGHAPVDDDTNPGRLARAIVEGIVEQACTIGKAVYGPHWDTITIDESTDDTLIVPFTVAPADLTRELRDAVRTNLDENMIVFRYGDCLPLERDRFPSRHTHP